MIVSDLVHIKPVSFIGDFFFLAWELTGVISNANSLSDMLFSCCRAELASVDLSMSEGRM